MSDMHQPSSAELACEVLVIGAGPAGAFLAGLLAARGVDVILVERSSFPRAKVCGCCLGAGALEILSSAGAAALGDTGVDNFFDRLVCRTGATGFELAIPRGRSLSRERFDASLVRWGMMHGVRFMPETRARAKEVTADFVHVELAGAQRNVSCNAGILVCADGIGSTSLANFPQFAFRVDRSSRVGIGAIFEKDCCRFDRSAIYMHYHPQGYLGAVRLEDDRVNFAASIDVRFLQEEGPEQACRRIMRYAGGPDICFSLARWTGTPALTRYRSCVADWRIFVIGDAAGYVEPFTGEGMTSALASAQMVAPIIVEAVREWHCDSAPAWQLLYRKSIQHNQTICRLATEILHNPRLVNLSAGLLSAWPSVGTGVAAFINKSYTRRCG